MSTANLSSDQEKLLQELNQFNKDYARYIYCNDSKNSASCGKTEASDLLNKLTQTEYPKIMILLNNINADATNTNVVQSYPANFTESTTLYNGIVANRTAYDSLINLRNDLDAKLKELNNSQDSIQNMYKQSYDRTIYTGMLLTAAATACIYYLFTQI